MLLSQIFAMTPAERRAFKKEQGEPTHRANDAAQEPPAMNNTRPPIAHTHRGKPVDFALQGHHKSTKTGRAPTHRKPGPAVVPEKFKHLAIAQETRYA